MMIKRIKTPVSQLQVGMFVADLDRPWVETPFPLQGFYIRNARDIEALEAYCKYVYVDREQTPEALLIEPVAADSREKRTGQTLVLPPVVIRNRQTYEASTSLKKETAIAEKVHARLTEVLGSVRERLSAGKLASMEEVSSVASDMTESVIRNPDALMWLTRVQARTEYSYQHAINASVLSLVFGRHLGLERSILKMLATGILLSQVGKAKLPQELLDKQGMLKPDEFEAYKKFVTLGVEILQSAGNISPQVISVVEFHRERHNGTGFPKGITGEKIPLLGKIAGIVDYYQELTEPHPGITPLTSLEAVGRLYESRNIEFQEDLVEKFIQAVGVYPTGTLVELSSQEVGIVVEHNPERKLWPKVMLVLDADKKPLKQGKVIDLKSCNEKGRPEEHINIAASLPFGAYEIDPSQLRVPGGSNLWGLRKLVG